MPDGSADLILTDPPYHTTTLRFDRSRANDYDDIYRECARVLKPAGWMFVWGTPETCAAVSRSGLMRRKFEYVWLKLHWPPRRPDTIRPATAHELCFAMIRADLKKMADLYFRPELLRTAEGKAYVDGGGHRAGTTHHAISERYYLPPNRKIRYPAGRECTTVLRAKNKSTMRPRERTAHPTQKPQPILELIIRGYCPPGGMVVDPFAGSASTLLAARAVGRSAVGWERDDEWYRLAAARVDGALESYAA